MTNTPTDAPPLQPTVKNVCGANKTCMDTGGKACNCQKTCGAMKIDYKDAMQCYTRRSLLDVVQRELTVRPAMMLLAQTLTLMVHMLTPSLTTSPGAWYVKTSVCC